MHIKINGEVNIFLTILLVLFAFLIVPYIVMHLWNWLMPAIFGLKKIKYKMETDPDFNIVSLL